MISSTAAPLILISACMLASAARLVAVDEPEASPWKDASGNLAAVDGPLWHIGAVPGADTLVASMRDHGLWASDDGGASWRQLGAPGARAEQGLADHMVFDPKDRGAFWTSGMYGFGVWKTAAGGATMTKLGPETHTEGIDVDFSDPHRATILITKHESERSLTLSKDGGATWTLIGDRLPAGTNFTCEPIILDAKTWLINCAGYKKDESWGIYRSEDAGATWKKVSEAGACGHQLVSSDGSIYWPALWAGTVVVSRDRGATWSQLGGPARGAVIEIPGKRLVALGEGHNQLLVSSNAGTSWAAIGEATPFPVKGLAYDEPRRAFITWREAKGQNSVLRWDLPPGDQAFAAHASALKVWNGEGYAGGGGWMGGGAGAFLKPTTSDHFDGTACLEFHVENAAAAEGGWNWFNWAQTTLTDVSAYKTLSLAIKCTDGADAAKRPTTVRVCLNCGPNKISSAAVDISAYGKELLDGQWHRLSIPLADLQVAKPPFDQHSVYELRLSTTSPAATPYSILVDAVAFAP